MNDLELYAILAELPDDFKKEAHDFVEFLKTKMVNKEGSKKREAGLAKGLIEMSEDFDDPLDDFNDYRQ